MQFKSTILFIILGIFSLSVLVSAQNVASNEQIQAQDVELVRRAKGDHTSTASTDTSSASSQADSSTTNSKSTTTTTTHGGGNNNGLPYASPAILENGTLFYIALSATCLLWVTGKAIDVATDRLDKHAGATAHKI